MLSDNLILDVGFRPGDEPGFSQVNGIEPFIIDIGTVDGDDAVR